MNALGRLLVFVTSLFGFRRKPAFRPKRTWRPAYPVHQDFVQGQLSAGDIYRLLHGSSRGIGSPHDAIPV